MTNAPGTRSTSDSLPVAGLVVAIHGVVVEAEFPPGPLPEIHNALTIEHPSATPLVVEVHAHLSDTTVQCLALSSANGLRRGLAAIDTGGPPTTPVGDTTLGRVLTSSVTLTRPCTTASSKNGGRDRCRHSSRPWRFRRQGKGHTLISWRHKCAAARACELLTTMIVTGATAEVVQDGVTGFLVNSVEEMVAAVGGLDEIDLRACCRHVAASGYLRVYQSILEQRPDAVVALHSIAMPRRRLYCPAGTPIPPWRPSRE